MSSGLQIDFYNATGRKVTFTAKAHDSNDWESTTENYPDVDIDGLSVDPWKLSAPVHLERNNGIATAPFIVTATIGTEDLMFQIDGCDATDANDRASIPIVGGTSDCMVLQVYTAQNEIDNTNMDYPKLTVFLAPRVDPAKWMAEFQDKSLLDLNVPGAHDAGTYGGSGFGDSQCQTLTIAEQLAAGVRFFDLRLAFYPAESPTDLEIYHGPVRQNVWLAKDVMPAVEQFLAHHPTECVVFCVNGSSHVDGSPMGLPFDKPLRAIMAASKIPVGKHFFSAGNVTGTTLGQLKGGLVLLRRDPYQTFGINVADWPDNNAYAEFPFSGDSGPKTGTIRLQDAYSVDDSFEGVIAKWGNVKGQLGRAATHAAKPDVWYMNWTNASFSLPLDWTPWSYATMNDNSTLGHMRGVNFLLAQHLAQSVVPQACRFGTVVMDYVEEPLNNTLIRLLLAWNRQI